MQNTTKMTARRRKAKGSDSQEPDHATIEESSNIEVKGEQVSKISLTHTKHSERRSRTIVFIIGSLVGILVALFSFRSHVTADGLEGLSDIIPSDLFKDLNILSHTQQEKEGAANYDPFSVGLRLAGEGFTSHHPVIMIPGIISTGLESWGTEEPMSRTFFRKRLWGSFTMIRALVLDRALWKKHIMLNKTTGLDPDGIKLRAATGFAATDYFVSNYWIWNKIIENLAAIGYDPGTMKTASYDWRLSFINLEKRDQYYTRLKEHIESVNRINSRKSIIISHSMGSQVAFWFFKWVELEYGATWVEDNIESFINISGCLLGASKTLPSLLSGEMKDTAQLNRFAYEALEKFFGRDERAEIMRSLAGISSMLPKGGEKIWGNLTWAPEDKLANGENTHGKFIQLRDPVEGDKNLTVSGAIDYLLNTAEPWFRDQVLRSWSHSVAETEQEIEENERLPRKWINPLEARLPKAPSLKIFCFYGVGKETERSYFYKRQYSNNTINNIIDVTVNNNFTDRGVSLTTAGDGTVTTLSAGYMCVKGWKIKRYNPANVTVRTVEIPHNPQKYDLRGGPASADHVDILGNAQLNELILKVVSGQGDTIQDSIVSDIEKYADAIAIS